MARFVASAADRVLAHGLCHLKSVRTLAADGDLVVSVFSCVHSYFCGYCPSFVPFKSAILDGSGRFCERRDDAPALCFCVPSMFISQEVQVLFTT